MELFQELGFEESDDSNPAPDVESIDVEVRSAVRTVPATVAGRQPRQGGRFDRRHFPRFPSKLRCAYHSRARIAMT